MPVDLLLPRGVLGRRTRRHASVQVVSIGKEASWESSCWPDSPRRALAGAVLAAAAPAEAASTFHGCPAGAVCIYNGSSLDSGIESGGMYWSYGAHNLYNQYGDHAVINNQTGGAWLTFCGSSNGTGHWLGSEGPNTAYPPYDVDLTPVNSIILTSGAHSSCP